MQERLTHNIRGVSALFVACDPEGNEKSTSKLLENNLHSNLFISRKTWRRVSDSYGKVVVSEDITSVGTDVKMLETVSKEGEPEYPNSTTAFSSFRNF